MVNLVLAPRVIRYGSRATAGRFVGRPFSQSFKTSMAHPYSTKSVLTVSAALHLSGRSIKDNLKRLWSDDKVPENAASRFDNVGFDVAVTDPNKAVVDLKQTLKAREWDGVILGWCVRGHPEFTELFESLVGVVSEDVVEKTQSSSKPPKIIFCTGPDDVVNATLRNFPVGP
ncbi:hypothetical protein K431DRAFT_79896 [Polychaeton citri CBS 116435]|uniref:Uncharacterized protein n=1 Tax=Polychaeton citri CBS 116435 TaxID=1314669 RepID=A0A9P4QIU7_9PEZI|nr:hypothetical protein K431DRAFT_79896 [Polychaeton citri CBS 116435]